MLAYLSATGAKQGKFQGEGTGERKDWIPILAFTIDVAEPLDTATGHPSGKRQYQPVTVIKQWGASSPQGLTACATNEVLNTVAIEFVNVDSTGKETPLQNVTLTSAAISAVRRFIGDPQSAQGLQTGSSGAEGLEEWSFTFQKIQIEDVGSKASFADDWSS